MKKGFRIIKFKKNKPIFELRDVSKSFDGRPILKKISMEMHPGEIVGLLGPMVPENQHYIILLLANIWQIKVK